VTPDAFDGHPFLVNFTNGTYDLERGELRPHNREDFLTMMANAPYDPDAVCPVFTASLDVWSGGDTDTTELLLRAMAYSLTGSTSEEVAFILYSKGRSGKSKFVGAIKHAWGDYAVGLPPESLAKRKFGGGVSNDIARLRGKRFVVASETDTDSQLADGLFKRLTGGDDVTARNLNDQFKDFPPTHKLWLTTNHVPQIDDMSKAMSDRLVPISFPAHIPEERRDRELAEKLKAEAPGILALAVAFYPKWRKQGLRVPESVKAAVQSIREEMDPLTGFIEACCALEPEARVSIASLLKAYDGWAIHSLNPEERLNSREFAARIKELLGGDKAKITLHRGNTRGWRGIRLLTEFELEYKQNMEDLSLMEDGAHAESVEQAERDMAAELTQMRKAYWARRDAQQKALERILDGEAS
jgi:putative DNA primase/helicase